MTNQENATSKEEELKQLKQDKEVLESQIKIVADLNNLRDDAFFRQQLLISLERISFSLEDISSKLKK